MSNPACFFFFWSCLIFFFLATASLGGTEIPSRKLTGHLGCQPDREQKPVGPIRPAGDWERDGMSVPVGRGSPGAGCSTKPRASVSPTDREGLHGPVATHTHVYMHILKATLMQIAPETSRCCLLTPCLRPVRFQAAPSIKSQCAIKQKLPRSHRNQPWMLGKRPLLELLFRNLSQQLHFLAPPRQRRTSRYFPKPARAVTRGRGSPGLLALSNPIRVTPKHALNNPVPGSWGLQRSQPLQITRGCDEPQPGTNRGPKEGVGGQTALPCSAALWGGSHPLNIACPPLNYLSSPGELH